MLYGMAVTTIGITIVSLERSKEKKRDQGETEGSEGATADGEEKGEQAEKTLPSEEEMVSVESGGENAALRRGFVLAFIDMTLDVLGALITKQHGGSVTPSRPCCVAAQKRGKTIAYQVFPLKLEN